MGNETEQASSEYGTFKSSYDSDNPEGRSSLLLVLHECISVCCVIYGYYVLSMSCFLCCFSGWSPWPSVWKHTAVSPQVLFSPHG